jgi:hypothetical protein
MSRSHNFTDLSGKRFGRLVVVKEAGGTPIKWVCQCDCGVEKITSTASLRGGRCRSCGCLRVEVTVSRTATHGKTNSRLYVIWCSMRQRCNNPKTRGWKNYGGRGITVAPEWGEFEAFSRWAETSGYAADLSIERKDNDAGYGPQNCTWATRKEQSENRRNVKRAPDGRPWSRVATENGLRRNTYYMRLKYGWEPERAATP